MTNELLLVVMPLSLGIKTLGMLQVELTFNIDDNSIANMHTKSNFPKTKDPYYHKKYDKKVDTVKRLRVKKPPNKAISKPATTVWTCRTTRSP